MALKAWEMARELYAGAKPVIRQEEEQTWTDLVDTAGFYDNLLSLDWGSNVTGSGAPERIMVAAIQAMENRGYRVSERGYELLDEGLKAFERRDFVKLQQVSALLRRELSLAEPDPESPYWQYHYYTSFLEHAMAVRFPEPEPVDVTGEGFADQIRAGWTSQLIGGAMGTMVEGYTSANLYRAFGDTRDFLREPNTYNDDNTFELAFLDAFGQKGYQITPEDIALAWVGFIPAGWSAEEIAIRNIRNGIFPPESGTYRNPFNEWIGAQMRSGICGMCAPGNPYLAAELAWKDGQVSHAGNGILGGVFNAVMTSLAFVWQDVRRILKTAIDLIPADSEYAQVVRFAWNCCEAHESWQDALADCEKQYERYNWIHAYPNACNEVIALYYGGGDFEETLHIITMCGADVDCNAGMIMPVLAINGGMASIPERFLHPAFTRLDSYMRGRFRSISMDELTEETVLAVRKALKVI